MFGRTVNCIFLCRQSYKMHPLFVFNTEVQLKVLFSIPSNDIIINIAGIKSSNAVFHIGIYVIKDLE